MNPLHELRKKRMQQTRKQVQIKYGEQERSLIHAVNAVEELDASFNLLFERTREWYHAVFPELERTVNEPETFLRLVFEIGSKKNFSKEKMESIVKNSELQQKIVKAASQSVGSTEEQSVPEIQVLALNALNLKEQRKLLEGFLESEMKKQAPNFTQLATPLLGARLLSKAGSFKRLAEMPASTLQLLGAEKALFRHLKSKRKTPAPKYGFLYGHSLVKQLPPQSKGAMARTLASKLGIALKADVFGKTPIADRLNKQLQARFEQLKQKPAKTFREKPSFAKTAPKKFDKKR